LGTFQDLSLNNRAAQFPAQLRAQLTEAYQRSGVTLLEREYVNTLLQEVCLDLAGLTESSGAALPRMQSAFWLVDGYYQSYETSGYEVELVLNVQRIFGRQTSVLLRDQPGPPLVRKVKAEIDQALAAQAAVVAPTRLSEAQAHMDAGKELLLTRTFRGRMPERLFLVMPLSGGADDRRKRNLEEAIRAFQTVLLLEPTNRAAKLYLAAALRTAPFYREDEARRFYREILDEPVKDKWVEVAQQALNSSLRDVDPEERARWLQPVALQATNPSAEFFQREARRAAVEATLQRGDSPKRQELAEERLFDYIAKFEAGQTYDSRMGMTEFMAAFGTDRAAGARCLAELYPKMKARATNSAPYLLASVVLMQVDTNAPVIAEFEQSLDDWVEHPERIPRKTTPFWNHVDMVYQWSQEHKLHGLADRILEAKLRASGSKPGGPLVGADDDKLRLAFGYKASGRWQEALKVFESYTNHPILTYGKGPWGRGRTVVLTSREAAECRQHLGLPSVQDPREFDLGKQLMCLHTSGYAGGWEMNLPKIAAFAAAPDGLWLAFGGRLLLLDANLRTNLVIKLPMDAATPIACVCATPAEIWTGTQGAGLIRCDLVSHECSRLTEKEGLLMDFIYSLQPAGDTLWIGYGGPSGGGLGKLDLRSRHATSFTPSLAAGRAEVQEQLRSPVVSIAVGPEDDVWWVAAQELHHYRTRAGQWEAPLGLGHASALFRAGDNLFVGMGLYGTFHGGEPTGLGLRTLSLTSEQWKVFPPVAELPGGVIALAPDGANVWVGGPSYIALVDPAQGKVLRFAYVSVPTVDQIQVSGGCVWAQCDKHLYKASLAAMR
jgi:hypothetical protein